VLLACVRWDQAQVALVYLFAVMSKNVLEQNVKLKIGNILSYCYGMFLTSPAGQLRLARALLALIYSRTTTC
jgi:hypothetical protein